MTKTPARTTIHFTVSCSARVCPYIRGLQVSKVFELMDYTKLTESELLQAHAGVIEELQRRGVVRTRNNPIGDYTEWLVCEHLSLTIQPNSMKSCDGIDSNGIRYQIKGRRAESGTAPVQFSVIRNYEKNGFDFLIVVIYNSDYTIRFAAKIPHAVLPEISKYRRHVNGHVPLIRDSVLNYPGVIDITAQLQRRSE